MNVSGRPIVLDVKVKTYLELYRCSCGHLVSARTQLAAGTALVDHVDFMRQ